MLTLTSLKLFETLELTKPLQPLNGSLNPL